MCVCLYACAFVCLDALWAWGVLEITWANLLANLMHHITVSQLCDTHLLAIVKIDTPYHCVFFCKPQIVDFITCLRYRKHCESELTPLCIYVLRGDLR